MTITEKLLATENYVDFGPAEKTTLEYKLAYLIKEAIREHKWNRGTEGVVLSWDQARDEWMNLCYKDFVAYARNLNAKKKARTYSLRTYERRTPVITGGLV